MKTARVTLILFLILIPHVLRSQYTDFDISRYKLPEIRTSRFDLQLAFTNNYNRTYREGTSSFDYLVNNTGGLLNGNLYQFRNMEKYQGEQSLSVYYNPSRNKSNLNGDLTESNYHNMTLSLFSTNRFFNSSGNFIEAAADINYDPNVSRSKDGDVSERNITQTFDISLPVSVGHGRIEPVEDARLAVYILDELDKADRIINRPDDAVILELARRISEIRKKRFFDSRIRKIEELQTIDSFLVDNNIVSANDIVYFTRLNDQWDYANGPQRNSGFSVDFGLTDKISVARDWTETSTGGADLVSSTFKMNEFTVGAFGRLQYSRPINLYWQTDLTLRLPYSYLFTRDPRDYTNDINDYNTHRIYPALDYSIQYLPSSRTSFGLRVVTSNDFLAGRRLKYNDALGSYIRYDAAENRFSISPSFNMYYYISPRLRLQANWSLSFRNVRTVMKSSLLTDDEVNKMNDIYNNLSVNFIYSFF